MPRLVAPVVAAGTVAARVQPTLDGGRVVLRPWTADDRQQLVEAFADPDIQRWHLLRIDSPAEAEAWIDQAHAGWQTETVATWAITAEDPTEAVGRISLYLHDLSNGLGEISYWVVPRARGAGVATDALATVATWAVDELGRHRLEVTHALANPASCRVADKAGFEVEGTRSSALLHADGWHDVHVHRRIAPD